MNVRLIQHHPLFPLPSADNKQPNLSILQSNREDVLFACRCRETSHSDGGSCLGELERCGADEGVGSGRPDLDLRKKKGRWITSVRCEETRREWRGETYSLVPRSGRKEARISGPARIPDDSRMGAGVGEGAVETCVHRSPQLSALFSRERSGRSEKGNGRRTYSPLLPFVDPPSPIPPDTEQPPIPVPLTFLTSAAEGERQLRNGQAMPGEHISNRPPCLRVKEPNDGVLGEGGFAGGCDEGGGRGGGDGDELEGVAVELFGLRVEWEGREERKGEFGKRMIGEGRSAPRARESSREAVLREVGEK